MSASPRSLGASAADDVLRLHLLGADQREGSTRDETAEAFAPLCALLAGSRWREISILLCGPNCFGPRGEATLARPAVVGGAAALRVRYT